MSGIIMSETESESLSSNRFPAGVRVRPWRSSEATGTALCGVYRNYFFMVKAAKRKSSFGTTRPGVAWEMASLMVRLGHEVDGMEFIHSQHMYGTNVNSNTGIST